MKQWITPTVDVLNIAKTASGGDPDLVERNGGFCNGYWQNATYNAVDYDKCEGQGSVVRKHKPGFES